LPVPSRHAAAALRRHAFNEWGPNRVAHTGGILACVWPDILEAMKAAEFW